MSRDEVIELFDSYGLVDPFIFVEYFYDMIDTDLYDISFEFHLKFKLSKGLGSVNTNRIVEWVSWANYGGWREQIVKKRYIPLILFDNWLFDLEIFDTIEHSKEVMKDINVTGLSVHLQISPKTGVDSIYHGYEKEHQEVDRFVQSGYKELVKLYPNVTINREDQNTLRTKFEEYWFEYDIK